MLNSVITSAITSANLSGRVCGDRADDLEGGGGGVVAVGVPGGHQGGVCRYIVVSSDIQHILC